MNQMGQAVAVHEVPDPHPSLPCLRCTDEPLN